MAKWSLLWPLTFGVACARSSEPTAFCSDDIAYLQTKASQAICDPNVLNSGRCVGDGACFGCVPASDGQKIPTNDTNGFPTGFLLCENDPDVNVAATCTISSSSPFAYSFQNPKNYLQCTDSSACSNWRVKDFAALCCDGNSACRTGLAQDEANFALTSGNPNCLPDVCCRGIRACSSQTNISGVSSAACRSFNACEEVTMFLSRDLFCSRPAACRQGIFRFAPAAGPGPSTHCVQCLDAGSPSEPFAQPCEGSQMSFTAGNVELQCAFNTCGNSNISLSGSSCIHIKCEDSVSCGGMSVVDEDSSGSGCFCSGPGCSNLVGPLTCQPTTANPCGENICKEDRSPRAFCDRGLHAPPDCSECASGGDVVGDPHITTLDGRRYTMLQQGNFLLWSFSGLDADVPVNGQMRRIPLDFRIYSHYSGHASFTKGILLVDHSGAAAPRQALEVTSLDCAWKVRQSSGSWRRSATEFLKLEVEGASFGAFNVTASKAWHERRGLERLERYEVQLLMRQSGWTRIAQLRVTCKPGHHIAAKLKMSSTAQNRFVKGELAPSGHSTLVAGLKGRLMAKDTEFAVDSWRDLGGSQEAARYLASTGAEGSEILLRCEWPEETAALEVCQKHWALAKEAGDSSKFVDSPRNEVEKANFLADCAFDVCAGGETAAQLAADLLNFE